MHRLYDAALVRSGAYDNLSVIQDILRGIKRGRKLALSDFNGTV